MFANGINEATFLTNQSTDFSVLVNQCEFLQINVEIWHIHKWFSLCHFGSVVSVKVTARAKSPIVLSRGFAARDFGGHRSIHPQTRKQTLWYPG